jgi:hypothetical protein
LKDAGVLLLLALLVAFVVPTMIASQSLQGLGSACGDRCGVAPSGCGVTSSVRRSQINSSSAMKISSSLSKVQENSLSSKAFQIEVSSSGSSSGVSSSQCGGTNCNCAPSCEIGKTCGATASPCSGMGCGDPKCPCGNICPNTYGSPPCNGKKKGCDCKGLGCDCNPEEEFCKKRVYPCGGGGPCSIFGCTQENCNCDSSIIICLHAKKTPCGENGWCGNSSCGGANCNCGGYCLNAGRPCASQTVPCTCPLKCSTCKVCKKNAPIGTVPCKDEICHCAGQPQCACPTKYCGGTPCTGLKNCGCPVGVGCTCTKRVCRANGGQWPCDGWYCSCGGVPCFCGVIRCRANPCGLVPWGGLGAPCPRASVAVGGISFSVNKFGLLAPYAGLYSTFLGATVASAVYVKRVKRRKEKQ